MLQYVATQENLGELQKKKKKRIEREGEFVTE